MDATRGTFHRALRGIFSIKYARYNKDQPVEKCRFYSHDGFCLRFQGMGCVYDLVVHHRVQMLIFICCLYILWLACKESKSNKFRFVATIARAVLSVMTLHYILDTFLYSRF